MGRRAKARRRGQRKEAAKQAAKVKAREQRQIWAKLSNAEPNPKLGYTGNSKADVGFFYAPYVPIFTAGSYIVSDTTA